MKKEDMLKIAAVLIIFAFIAEQFYFGFINSGQKNIEQITNNKTIGSVKFNAQIRTYDPFLILEANTSDLIISEFQKDPSVINVKKTAEYILFETETRDEVYNLAQKMRLKGLKPLTSANLIMPSHIDVKTENGTINATNRLGVVKIDAEPIIDVDNEVMVSMDVIVNNGVIVQAGNGVIIFDKKILVSDAKIEQILENQTTYIIPWEDRNKINETFERKNIIFLGNELNTSQIIEKKTLEYITYIDRKTIEVKSDFSDKNRIMTDFGNISLTFVPSILKSNQNYSYNSTTVYTYQIKFPTEVNGYLLEKTNQTFTTERKFEINQTNKFIVNAVVVGNKIIDFTFS